MFKLPCKLLQTHNVIDGHDSKHGHIGDHDCSHIDGHDELEDGIAVILLVFLHLLRLPALRHLGHHLQG